MWKSVWIARTVLARHLANVTALVVVRHHDKTPPQWSRPARNDHNDRCVKQVERWVFSARSRPKRHVATARANIQPRTPAASKFNVTFVPLSTCVDGAMISYKGNRHKIDLCYDTPALCNRVWVGYIPCQVISCSLSGIRHLLCIKVACKSMKFWSTVNDEYCGCANGNWACWICV